MNYEVRILTGEKDLKRYDAWARARSHGNLWQSLERKKYLEACGKEVRIYAAENDDGDILASALCSIDRTTGGFSTWEIPRGPLWKEGNEKNIPDLLETIISHAKKDRCLALYLSPMGALPESRLRFVASPRRIHAEATRIIDLTQTEEQILAQMHAKGRYNISLAKKHGIEVETRDSRVSTENDIDAFYDLLQNTGSRDGFKISQKSHYAHFLTDLESSFILMAKHQGKAVAGLLGVMWNGTGFYYYGASSYDHRHLMAPYLLQWEAMLHCKKAGCTRYDLLGIENPENENSKNQKPNSNQGSWAGITDFKRKFGGVVITYPPEQMMVLKPILKMMLEWKRRMFG